MYISKAKLISLIERNYRQWGDEYDAMQILGDIEDMPEEDESLTETGEWISTLEAYADYMPPIEVWRCSVCAAPYEEWVIKPTWAYCPRCGAKMEGEDG